MHAGCAIRLWRERLALSLVLMLAVGVAWPEAAPPKSEVPPPEPSVGPGGVWLSEPPAGCPFHPSETLKGLRFTGRHAEYPRRRYLVSLVGRRRQSVFALDGWGASTGWLAIPAAVRPPPAMRPSSATIR